MSVKLDAKQFERRLLALRQKWTHGSQSESENGPNAILITAGEVTEESVYQKSTALHSWLFQFEFPDTLLLVPRDSDEPVYVLASQKKAQLLKQELSSSSVEVVSYMRSNKDLEMSKESIKLYLGQLKRFGKIGSFIKDKPTGKWISEWSAQHYSADFKSQNSIEEVDCSPLVAECLAIKDEAEVKLTRQASRVSSLVMKNYFVEEMAALVDEEQQITHEKFAEKIEQALYDAKTQRKIQIPADVQAEFLDYCYTPIVQSGVKAGDFDLKPSAVSNGEEMKSGTILCSLGVRYRNYCSNVSRSYLIDPTKEQEANYAFLLELQKYVIQEMKDGIVAKDLYEKAVKYVQEHRPELSSHFVKNLGFVTGLEFRESTYVLNGKCLRTLSADMSVNLSIGFSDLKLDNGDRYALLLADTVLVSPSGASYLTDAPRDFRMISFFFKDDDEDAQEEAVKKEKAPVSTRGGKSAILKTKLRAESRREEDVMSEQNRKDHQSKLLMDRVQAGLDRFTDGSDKAASGEQKKSFRRYESYKKDVPLPKEVRNNRIIIDKRNETVLLPVFGSCVPFHLNTIKNVTKSDEGEFVYLRFNFQNPAQIAKKDETVPYDDPNATFVRSLSFRSKDTVRYNELYRQITELKRDIQKKENERKLRADLVEQDNLVESKRPIAILGDVSIRPNLEGKKLPGDVQIHSNGLRYQPIRGDQRVDVLFSNIKHLFFQPCDHELYVILHCHLKNPIMIGKKKTKDVQFYRDVSDGGFDETNNRRGRKQFYNDEDELMAEQEERIRKQKMNKEFKTFAEKVAEVSGYLEADLPIRELGFNGVPSRTNVLMQPTTECLVHLSDPPFTVITLADVEIAYLERVQFHLKNFDIVFVLRDFKETPLHINSIPMKQLEPIKEWLDSVDIPYIEGPLNLNWTNIMKNINQDPAGFYEDGGWQTLLADDEEEGEDAESDEESEYAMSEVESEEDDESESEEDSDDFDESDAESGGSEEEFDESEDEDELRPKSKADDRKRRSPDHDSRPSKKRR